MKYNGNNDGLIENHPGKMPIALTAEVCKYKTTVIYPFTPHTGKSLPGLQEPSQLKYYYPLLNFSWPG